jgi:integrase/recombinase XerD
MRLPEDYSGATSDEHLVELWLHGRPTETQRAYRREARRFLASLGDTGLQEAKVADLIAWADTLKGKASTKARSISAAKSLLSYAHRTGYTVFNVGVALRCPKLPSELHKRIVETAVVKAMLEVDGPERDLVLVRFLYVSGARISEATGLDAEDIRPGRVTLHGKGSKTRTIVVPEAITAELLGLNAKGAIFRNYKGGRLSSRYARIIVGRISKEAGHVLSPHWLRHAHASHALDNGAPIHLVKESLGHSNISTTSRYLHARPNQGSGQYLPV